MLTPSKILVPTDFSEDSDRALTQALDIAGQYHARVFLLHVTHEAPVSPHPFPHSSPEAALLAKEMYQQINDHFQAKPRKKLQIQLSKCPKVKEVGVDTDVRQGIACEEILKEEKEKGIDLIVIASLGRSRAAKTSSAGWPVMC